MGKKKRGVWMCKLCLLARPGSVVVDHTIIVSLAVTSQSEEKLHNITAKVQEKIEVVATQLNCTNGTLSPRGGDNRGHPWGGGHLPTTPNPAGRGCGGVPPQIRPLLQATCASTPPRW